MGETAPDAEQDHVPQAGRLYQSRSGEQEAQIALLAAMVEPIARVGPRVERLDKPEVAIDAHQQHGAVDADAADVRHVMIGRADPGADCGDDRGALAPLARWGKGRGKTPLFRRALG